MTYVKLKKYLAILLSIIMISCSSFVPTKTYGAGENDSTITTKSSLKVIDTGKATIDGVSVRSANSASGKYLGSLYTGDKVEIVDKTENGWYKIKYNKSYAYVSELFIKLSGTKTIDKVLNTGIVYNTTKLTVRGSCSTKSKFLGYLPKNTKVYILRATSTNWYKIKYKDSYAYVKGNYIKLTSSKGVISTGSATEDNVSVRKRESNDSNRKNLNDFLFVGDSFTDRLRQVINSNNESVYIHAQSGSRPSYWLDKVDDMPDKNNIDGISILIGVNGVTVPTNIRDTKALINQLIVKYPDKTIYVQNVFPVGENFTGGNKTTYNKAIIDYNKQLKEFCDTKENVKIIDATSGFINNRGFLINTSDGLHIDDSSASKFYSNIFNSIKNAQKNR